jgi:1,2-dihydroxy-3-keto-5-methylthiopentene dioxygenase
MAMLRIYQDNNPHNALQQIQDKKLIAVALNTVGVRYQKWQTEANIKPGDSAEKIISAYQTDIDGLIAEEGYQSMDVVSLNSDHPQKAELRKKFLDEHTHAEDEVRFFVAGQGLFSLHISDKVYEVLCTQGDLISVPANTPHWFDMGPNPHFVAIRLFNNPDGWVAKFTGNDIATHFNRLQN